MFTEVYHESDIARFMHNANSFFESGDFVGAYLNYAIAASLGFSNAGLNLAYMFEKNLLDDICLKSSTFCQKAFLLQTAYLTGAEEALVRLGDIYWNQADPDVAFEFYSAAPAHPKGLYSIGYMHTWGVGTPQNYTAAEDYFFTIIEATWQREFDWRYSVPAITGLFSLYGTWSMDWMFQSEDWNTDNGEL